MPIASPRYNFLRATILGAPEDPGVYALWQGAEIIYFGFAERGAATIQSRLIEHFSRQREPSQITHYSWEICKDVLSKWAELIREHKLHFGRLPRHNQDFGSSSTP